MGELSILSQISLYVLMALLGLVALLVGGWQMTGTSRRPIMVSPWPTISDLPCKHRRHCSRVCQSPMGILSVSFGQSLVCLG